VNGDPLQAVKALDPVPDAELPEGTATPAMILQQLDEQAGSPFGARRLPAPGPRRLWMRPAWVATVAFVVVLIAGAGSWLLLRSGDDVVTPPTTVVPTTTIAPTTTDASTAPTTASPATTSPPTDQQPATPFGAAPSLSSSFFTSHSITEPGAVVFHDGLWHMFYRGVEWDDAGGNPAGDGTRATIGYATSSDGRVWEDVGAIATVGEIGIPLEDTSGVRISSAMVTDEGGWELYFHTFRPGGGLFSGGVIGRMTAPAPTGPWTTEPSPLLTPGPAGSWDSAGLAYPSVLRVGDQLWMYYDGHSGDLDSVGDRAVGLAVSDDGSTWQKYDDPETTSDRLNASDPVLTTTQGSWDEHRVLDANVVLTAEGFVMTYLTNTVSNAKIGVAFSDDGITWMKSEANPVFDHDRRGFTYTGATSLIYTGDAYVLVADLAGQTGDTTTSVWTWAHEGPIRPPAG
jgi:predicted GH43/DUF377 family glycosyl hydrolase